MDLSKFQFEKIISFIAGVIPGFVALLLYDLVHPGIFYRIMSVDFLGYRLKAVVVVTVAFVIGNSMTAIVNALLAAIGGGIGGYRGHKDPYVPPYQYKVAPWRDQRWRIALAKELGPNTPNDSSLLPDAIWDQRRKLVDNLPVTDRLKALYDVNMEKLKSESDDLKWEQWYDHYHQIVLREQHTKGDFAEYFQRGLFFNLETSAMYALLATIFVPAARHWWVFVPCTAWVVLLVAQTYGTMSNFFNKWSTLSAQIAYLSKPRS